MSIDQRGFKSLIQQEAQEFIKPGNLILNTTVKSISYSNSGVTVTLTSGKKVTGSYAICTFSLGVLQNNRVEFQPPLPGKVQSSLTDQYVNCSISFQSGSHSKHDYGNLYESVSPLSKEVLVRYGGENLVWPYVLDC